MTGVKGTAGQAYHALGQEFNRVVPEAEGLNSRISNLIPVARRGEAAELTAPTSQRIASRLLAHTGALAGAGFGGTAGYHQGGPMGGCNWGWTRACRSGNPCVSHRADGWSQNTEQQGGTGWLIFR